jgi:hypothetical protein
MQGLGRMFWGYLGVGCVKDKIWHRVEVEGQGPEGRGWFGADVVVGAQREGDTIVRAWWAS